MFLEKDNTYEIYLSSVLVEIDNSSGSEQLRLNWVPDAEKVLSKTNSHTGRFNVSGREIPVSGLKDLSDIAGTVINITYKGDVPLSNSSQDNEVPKETIPFKQYIELGRPPILYVKQRITVNPESERESTAQH